MCNSDEIVAMEGGKLTSIVVSTELTSFFGLVELTSLEIRKEMNLGYGKNNYITIFYICLIKYI